MMTRKEAIELGLTRYNTGEPCKHGHLADRFVQSCNCTKCHQGRKTPHDPDNKKLQKMRLKGHLRRSYDITVEAYNQLLIDQGGACAICKTLLVGSGHDKDAPHLDHCHATGRVRGMLCPTCNRVLGSFNDDVERFKSAIAYLQT